MGMDYRKPGLCGSRKMTVDHRRYCHDWLPIKLINVRSPWECLELLRECGGDGVGIYILLES